MGNYFGNGLSLMWSVDGQSFIVTNVIKDSPADKEGIKRGDKIIAINNIKVMMANNQSLMNQVTLNKDEEVEYKVLHQGTERVVSLKSQQVTLTDVETQDIEGHLYIKINVLQQGTAIKIDEIIEQKSKNNKGIILDLRDIYSNNIEEVGQICDLFLSEGNAFKISTKDVKMYPYKMQEKAYKGKLCILINHETKGAVEILASALKQQAHVIGSSTSGLYYIRELIPLENGSGMSVAVAQLYDGYGNTLPEKGIEPDETIYLSEKESLELLENGFISRQDDPFIKAALAYLKLC